MRKILASFAFLSGLALTAPVVAAPIEYQLTFTVESYDEYDDNGQRVNDIVLTPIVIGQKFYGRLVVDDSAPETLGPLTVRKVLDFHAQIGQSVWDTNMPPNGTLNPANPNAPLRYDFGGLRGPCNYSITSMWTCTSEQLDIWTLGSEFWGFGEVNGIASHIYGGVFGYGDEPFIDYWGDTFSASPTYLVKNPILNEGAFEFYYIFVPLRGSLSIARVPEPGILALLSLGFIGLAAFRRNPYPQSMNKAQRGSVI